MGHPEMPKYLKVVFWLVSSSIRTDLVDRTHECNELVWNNPVQVSVLNLLVILILFVVELAEVVPSMANCDFEPLQAVEDAAAVGTVTVAGVSERSETSLVRSKGFPSHLSRLLQDNNHEGAHQVGSIGLLIEHI